MPLLVLYEIGVVLWVGTVDIRARGLLRVFFEHLGVTGYYLPGLVVVVVLIVHHLVRQDPWRPEPKLYGGMWLESAVLTVPLLVFMAVLFREPVTQLALSAAGNDLAQVADWRGRLILPIGAGIYEELVFRMIALAALHLLLVDLLALPEQHGTLAAVAISSVAFALYHFPQPNPWHWSEFWAGFNGALFAFYTLAGLYLAGLYHMRGFGIVVAVHALYDVVLALILISRGGSGG